MIGADIRHFVFLAKAEHTLKIMWRMLSIICRNQKNGILSDHLKIASKNGKIKRMLSMRYRLFSVCSACAT
jgi:hypothetical protein